MEEGGGQSKGGLASPRRYVESPRGWAVQGMCGESNGVGSARGVGNARVCGQYKGVLAVQGVCG